MPTKLCGCARRWIKQKDIRYYLNETPYCTLVCFTAAMRKETLRELERREAITRNMGV